MVGRLDDWLKVQLEKHNLSVDPGYLEWAGVAVFKKAYKIFEILAPKVEEKPVEEKKAKK